jgi:hypothetical protein
MLLQRLNTGPTKKKKKVLYADGQKNGSSFFYSSCSICRLADQLMLLMQDIKNAEGIFI